jgi:hypothetical protein
VVSSWPLRDEPLKSAVMAVASFGLASLVAWRTDSLLAGLAAVVLLGAALWRMWLPVIFRLGPQGIVQVTLGHGRRRLWSHYCRYEILPHGMLLLTTADDSTMSRLTGLYIPWRGRRKELTELAQYYVAPQMARSDSTAKPRGSTQA